MVLHFNNLFNCVIEDRNFFVTILIKEIVILMLDSKLMEFLINEDNS